MIRNIFFAPLQSGEEKIEIIGRKELEERLQSLKSLGCYFE